MGPPSNIEAATIRVPKRAYQACVRCRRRKARCIVDGPAEEPNISCLRCRRERKPCVFTVERSQPQSTPPTHREMDTRPQRELPPLNELADRVSNTVVSTQTDALNLLFQAAETYNATELSARSTEPATGSLNPGLNLPPFNEWLFPSSPPMECSTESLRVFSKLKFVKKRWLTAQEAVTYVRLFFRNMSPFSPILDDFYCNPSNYSALIENEPVLCTVILTLSTRYHHLAGYDSTSRGYYLHNRLWRYCQSLLQRVIWGQEKGTKISMRGLGTIEGLLLMVDWHARSLHLPPDIEAWDSDDDNLQESELNGFIPNRWLQGVVEPMKRSDRMSWSLVQSAIAIGQELEVYDEEMDDTQNKEKDNIQQNKVLEKFSTSTSQRRRRLRILLYIYTNQLAFRIGFSSLIPQTLANMSPNVFKLPFSQHENGWLQLMSLWVDLTRLMRISADLLFPSKSETLNLIQSDRYQRILEHFKPMLNNWWEKYIGFTDQSPLRELLFIDYMYTKTYIYSIALQAVAERTMSYKETQALPDELLFTITRFGPCDYAFVQNVIDGAKDLLGAVITMARTSRVKFMPVRVYVRVISACIFLLKALALGVLSDELNSSLEMIDESARVLRQHIVDDLHLAGAFALLLETYTKGFRERFMSIPGISRSGGNFSGTEVPPSPTGVENYLRTGNMTQLDDDLAVEQDWLVHPFDSSIAPFGLGVTQPICGFDDELNFIWNTGGGT